MAFQVAVSGPSQCGEADERNARRVGELLAEQGAVVLCGGLHLGVMGAVAASVRESGGICVGILPGPDRDEASEHLTVVIPSGLGEARNNVLVQSADALIVLGGSWGTLSELALAMRRGGIPVIVVGGWKLLDANGQPVDGPHHVDTPEEAVELAFRAVPSASGHQPSASGVKGGPDVRLRSQERCGG
jgi:uncharacterized protein (TIGR00725 family)